MKLRSIELELGADCNQLLQLAVSAAQAQTTRCKHRLTRMKCAANFLATRRPLNARKSFLNQLLKFSAISNTDPSIGIHKHSLIAPEDFWGNAGKDIIWSKEPEKVLDSSKAPFFTWYKGGEMNTCYNCVDRHIVDGFGEQVAIIFDSPVTNTIRKITYNQLSEQVNAFAGLLVAQGVEKGDRVVIYMPNIPEASVAMLACARIGAIHSVVFGGFAAPELATRIRDSTPKLIICSSCGIDGAKVIEYKPLLDAAIELAADTHRVDKCIVFQRPQKTASMMEGRDIDWVKSVSKVTSPVKDCAALPANHPLYILYTSGTTGAPKGVLRDNGGHAVALKWTMDKVYGMKPGEVFWSASDVGWVVGHSFIVYGPLLHRLTTIMYEGKPIGTPDAANFWRTIERHSVSVLLTAPTALRVIKRADSEGLLPSKFNLSSLRHLFLVGERADPDTVHWAENTLKVPIRDHWWQTETGWPVCSNMVGIDGYIPVKYGSTYRPCPGYDIQVLDSDLKQVAPGTLGTLAIKLPLPPGSMLTLYNNDKRYISSYMAAIPGFYDTGDAGIIDTDGYVHVMSRTDDVINVAGHRLSCGAMEEILADHPDIAEVAVVGVRDHLRGHVPLGLFVLNDNSVKSEEDVKNEVVAMVREKLGPVAFFKSAVQVKGLPKTRSGKILRTIIRSIANGDEYKVPGTIESMDTIDEITIVIKAQEDILKAANAV